MLREEEEGVGGDCWMRMAWRNRWWRDYRRLWDHGIQIATEYGGHQIQGSGKRIHGVLLIHGNGSANRIHGVVLDLTEGRGVVLERGRGRSWLGLLLGRGRTRSAWRSRWGGEAAAGCGREEPR